MVELTVNLILDVLEVAHHAVLVQFLCLAVNRHDPVVAVEVLALAFIGEIQAVTASNLHSFAHIIHGSLFFNSGWYSWNFL